MNLRALRMNRGVTLARLSKETEVSVRTLIRLENGETTSPNADTAKRLADFYGVAVTDMWPVDDDPDPDGHDDLPVAA